MTVVIDDKHIVDDILDLYSFFNEFQNSCIIENFFYVFSDWLIERFNLFNENRNFIKLYKFTSELMENEAELIKIDKNNHKMLNTLIIKFITDIISDVQIIVYITKIKHRTLFNEENVKLYMADLNNCISFEKNNKTSGLRILCTNGNEIVPDNIKDLINIIVEGPELLDYADKCYPVDGGVYDRLFLDGKFKEVAKQKAEIWIAGTSTCLYNVLPQLMPRLALNSAINGQSLYYTILNIRKAISLNPKIDTIMIGLDYFSFSFDTCRNNPVGHTLSTISLSDFSIYEDSNGYLGEINPIFPKPEIHDPLLHHIVNIRTVAKIMQDNFSETTGSRSYFSDIYPRSHTGTVFKYTFQDKPDDLNLFAAKIMADSHFNMFNSKYETEVASLFTQFINELKVANKKIILFVSPMTNFYRAAVSQDKVDRFFELLAPIRKIPSVIFLDYYNNSEFDNSYFYDYLHLNERGATKFTKMLAKYVEKKGNK